MQILKSEVREKIIFAAKMVFCERGFIDSTLSDIASNADVAVGNIYRYFKNKADLLYAVVPNRVTMEIKEEIILRISSFEMAMPRLAQPHALEKELRTLFTQRIHAVPNNRTLLLQEKIEDQHKETSLIQYVINYRKEVVIILSGCPGTSYEGIRDEIISRLVSAYCLRNKTMDPVMCSILYDNLMTGILRILQISSEEIQMNERLKVLLLFYKMD